MAVETSVQEVQPIVYRYEGAPDSISGKKAVFHLGGTDIVRARIQVLERGKGETTLHRHVGVDTFWMVIKGGARFYGPGDVVIADLGPQEGIITPRGSLYWFESSGDEALELLQVASRDTSQPNQAVFSKDIRGELGGYDRYVLNEEKGEKVEIIVGNVE